MSFVHLHLHSEYSLLDGACRIKELVRSAKEKGQTAVAVTDHGNMFAAAEFYHEAKAQGIKPIIGCEVYNAQRTRFDRSSELDGSPYHLILLCENMQGYRNLIHIISLAWKEGFYKKPRIDDELLEQYHEGLICLSACLAGEIPRLITGGDIKKAYEKAKYYKRLFGEGNFFLELQDHGIPEQRDVNENLIRMSRELDIPLVATNDCHYIDKVDADIHDILLCIQTSSLITENNRMRFPTNEFYIKTEEEMRSLFPNIPQAIENTQLIADRCNVELSSGRTVLPYFKSPTGEDNETYFRRECREGLVRRYGSTPDSSITERLEYEMDVVSKMGYVDYYLIVNDFIRYARSQDIPVGPGRGSGAGSLAAYCLGITDVDPIKYALIFERFLNPERISMPDFDVDFCIRRRYEVIDYVKRKYGEDHVSQIISFVTLGAKSAVHDVGRVLGYSISEVNKINAEIPKVPDITIDAAFERSKKLRSMYENDNEVKRLIDIVRKIEGMPKTTSIHAAGVVITRDPVDASVPLSMNDNLVVTQYTMEWLEKLGLLKMDFLALRNLTVLDDAKKLILNEEPDFSDDKISYDDPEVYKMLSGGRTNGVFQLESAGMKNVITKIKPSSLEDLMVLIALYRPGPMSFIDTYRENKRSPENIKYKHPLLKNVLEVTYGCIVYQEQVMQIFRELAGYSFGQADLVRRAMAKKHPEEMQRERQKFIYGLDAENIDGCIKRGIDEKTAESIFADMESFSSYAFNKAHAAAYGVLAYRTAWYKYYYPKQYMAAWMTTLPNDRGGLAPYIEDCRNMGIQVLPPHINESGDGFSVHGESIFFGLTAIKGVGPQLAEDIVNERKKNGSFKSFTDFCTRMAGKRMNVIAAENLIRVGAFDGLGANRRRLFFSARKIIEGAEADRRANPEGQLSLFDDSDEEASIIDVAIPEMAEFHKDELLAMEKDLTGMYLSGHPLDDYKPFIESINADRISDILSEEHKPKKNYRLVVRVTEIRDTTTKKGDLMAFAKAEDHTGTIELIIFPKVFAKHSQIIREGEVIDIHASLSDDSDKKQLLLESASQAQREAQNPSKATQSENYRPRLFLRVPSKSSRQCEYAKKLIAVFDGSVPVSFYYEDNAEYDHRPHTENVYLNDVMMNELARVLGEKSVVLGKDNPNFYK